MAMGQASAEEPSWMNAVNLESNASANSVRAAWIVVGFAATTLPACARTNWQ